MARWCKAGAERRPLWEVTNDILILGKRTKIQPKGRAYILLSTTDEERCSAMDSHEGSVALQYRNEGVSIIKERKCHIYDGKASYIWEIYHPAKGDSLIKARTNHKSGNKRRSKWRGVIYMTSVISMRRRWRLWCGMKGVDVCRVVTNMESGGVCSGNIAWFLCPHHLITIIPSPTPLHIAIHLPAIPTSFYLYSSTSLTLNTDHY